MPAIIFNDREKEILRIVQADLPDSQTPFADIASRAGVSEEEVIDLLRKLKDQGQIRRFGATLRHQQAGYGFNAMVAWYVDAEKDIGEVGSIMAERPEITHCYERRNCLDWPYNLYTMIHGRSSDDCRRVVEELSAETGVAQYEMLFSNEELKKTSMKYF
ncbi:siroheme decarboxylase subunit beta [Desulfonatronovibrio hydrogenovorans]|uniref:siroheme decarboxylase subunit beta n=1 Tax=Desulfonatronovibrio hydrogenovorans TaxID=53245 RepID=UPI0004911C28|nr:siroheme decarboxylase subunit beta [Desulfonatronovibrio hydrogenovorans]